MNSLSYVIGRLALRALATLLVVAAIVALLVACDETNVAGSSVCLPCPPPADLPLCLTLGCAVEQLEDPKCLLTGALCECRLCDRTLMCRP